MTDQQQRVLAAARKAGGRGITAVDFNLPNVVDDGPPITRVAARINELQDMGFRFRSGGRRQKCKVYVLESVPLTFDWGDSGVPGGPTGTGRVGGQSGASESLQLFKDAPGNAIFGLEDAA